MREVQGFYKEEVEYHNDLHGADVALMANMFLTKGGLISLLELDKKDILSYLIAGLCHDLGHDGLTNGFHANAFTERGIRHNDISV